MTLRLILIRHAKSDQGDPHLADHDRPLNARGRRDAPRMADWIAAQGLVPDLVLCSDAQRTRETLDLMLPRWSPAPQVVHDPALYLAPPARLLAALRGRGAATLALVAHNPGIGELAAHLAAAPPDHPRWADYPTCAVAALAFDAPDWDALAEGTGRVLAFAVPADIG